MVTFLVRLLSILNTGLSIVTLRKNTVCNVFQTHLSVKYFIFPPTEQLLELVFYGSCLSKPEFYSKLVYHKEKNPLLECITCS